MKLERVSADEIGASIARAAGDDLPEILNEIRQGIAEAWKVDGGTAWMVTRIERHDGGRELVVVCLEGAGLDHLAPQIIEQARIGGIASIRVHSSRPGMGRMLARHGLREVERIYRVAIHGRQEQEQHQ